MEQTKYHHGDLIRASQEEPEMSSSKTLTTMSLTCAARITLTVRFSGQYNKNRSQGLRSQAPRYFILRGLSSGTGLIVQIKGCPCYKPWFLYAA